MSAKASGSGSALYSHKVKAEAAKSLTGRKKCAAALAGMIMFSHTLSPEKIVFQTENKDVRDLFIRLTEHICGEDAVGVSKKKRDPRPPIYTLSVSSKENISKLSSECGFNPDSENLYGERSLGGFINIPDKLFGSFCTGVFLSCGSVSEPIKGYHLEFATPHGRLLGEFQGMIYSRLSADGGMVRRRSSYVLYFKESENIEDILTLIGAPRASLELMNIKIYKDLRNRANRATNCDTANLDRQNRSAREQLEAIELIDRKIGLEKLPPELSEVAAIRRENPDMSLSELTNRFNPPLSRSGVNHRLTKLLKIAEELKNV